MEKYVKRSAGTVYGVSSPLTESLRGKERDNTKMREKRDLRTKRIKKEGNQRRRLT